jgi:hypothetical protein
MSSAKAKSLGQAPLVARLQGKTDLSLIHLLRTNADFMHFDALRDGKVDPIRIMLMSEYLDELQRRYPR